jgi:predicted deacetylase
MRKELQALEIKSMKKKILICLHDITPHHLSRIKKAEDLLHEWGVSKVNYFLIPNYHRKNSELDENSASLFESWIQDRRNTYADWILHGLYHIEEDTSKIVPLSLTDRIRRKYLTAREGEFLALDPTEITARLEQGILAFKNLMEHTPDTFVAPAWLFNRHLIPCLKKLKFLYTEDSKNIFILKNNQQISAPVITWAVRSSMRKFLSLTGCPILHRIWLRKSMIRIAVHPYDFDHPSIIRSIKNIITDALESRESILYRELDSIFLDG